MKLGKSSKRTSPKVDQKQNRKEITAYGNKNAIREAKRKNSV